MATSTMNAMNTGPSQGQLAHRRPGGSAGGPAAAAAARASGTARGNDHDGDHQASQQQPMSTSAARIAAAAKNKDRRIMVWVDALEFLSLERVQAVKGWQAVASALPTECASCGVKDPNIVPHTMGCDKHLICGNCDPTAAIKPARDGTFTCAARGCSTTVFNIKPIRLGNISCLRAKIDEALKVEQHACQMDDTRAQIANDGNASDGDDEDGDGAAAAGGKRKRGKMDADKAEAMKSKRRNTMQQKKEEMKRQIEQGAQAMRDLAAARTEIDQLKAHVSLLQMQLQEAQPVMDESPELLTELDLGELLGEVMGEQGC